MDRKLCAIEADHRLGHKLGAPSQLEYRVRDATPSAGKVGIGPLPGQIRHATPEAVLTPEDQPAPLHRGDMHEPAEIFPSENGTIVSRGAQRNPRLTRNPGSINWSCGDPARRAGHPRCS